MVEDSFAITCNKCGESSLFTKESTTEVDSISIYDSKWCDEDMAVHTLNCKCGNDIELVRR